MTDYKAKNMQKDAYIEEKILLGLLPFWTPLVPPLGISCLKSYLQKEGCRVKTFDTNTAGEFKEIYHRYFELLQESIPHHKRGNFFNLGHDVLENHMMAHLQQTGQEEYLALVKILLLKNYSCEINHQEASQLSSTIEEFYATLERYISNILEKESPTVLGLSVFRGTLAASLFTFKLAKARYPSIKTVMGGAIFSQSLDPGTPNMDFLLEKAPFIDKFIIGEGEKIFLKYLRGELPGAKKIYTLEDIERDHLDISKVDPPDFSDFDLQYYPYSAAYTSRSCPFQCSFCTETVYWGKYRKKSAGHIFAEMVNLHRQHGSQLFLMCDSLLNPVITGIARQFLNSEVSIYWDGYLRADKEVGNPDNALLWRRGGFYRARLGVESGSPKVLKLMGKKIGPGQIKEAISSLASAGIKTTTYWVTGHPGETKADFQQTLELLEELADDIYEAECNPFRYFLTGQVNSQQWEKNRKVPLYPEQAKNLLIVQTWILEGEPSWEETLDRLRQIARHCKKLGIPNPYTMNEILEADNRWKKLHKNAVPPLVDFENSQGYIRECKNIKTVNPSSLIMQHDGNWGF